MFIAFPGRDIGGIWTVFLPFSKDAWASTLAAVLVVPAFLLLCSKTLAYINMEERFSFGYGQNVFIFFNAISQQVPPHHTPRSRNVCPRGRRSSLGSGRAASSS